MSLAILAQPSCSAIRLSRGELYSIVDGVTDWVTHAVLDKASPIEACLC